MRNKYAKKIGNNVQTFTLCAGIFVVISLVVGYLDDFKFKVPVFP